MTVIAHAGHWLAQLIYLAPLVVLVGAIVAGRIKERRRARGVKAPSAGVPHR